MTNEEFQRIVLEKLGGLEEGQKRLEGRQKSLEERQKSLEEGQMKLEQRQIRLEQGQVELERGQKNFEEEQKKLVIKVDSMEKILIATHEQTAKLIEFKEEINNKIEKVIEENKLLKEMFGRHEIEIKVLQRKIG